MSWWTFAFVGRGIYFAEMPEDPTEEEMQQKGRDIFAANHELLGKAGVGMIERVPQGLKVPERMQERLLLGDEVFAFIASGGKPS